MLTINNTLDGYLKDVEIKGNTIQDASNLADIRSVGDKVEGQELYEIPVLSVGKNLCISRVYQDISDVAYAKVKIRKNCTYTISTSLGIGGGHISLNTEPVHTGNKQLISDFGQNKYTFTSNLSDGEYYLVFWKSGLSSSLNDTVQLEEGTVATPYEPYQEDKLTILSPVQLEKVGDVADRIICKDGVWGVEKNIVKDRLSASNIVGGVGVNDKTFDVAFKLSEKSLLHQFNGTSINDFSDIYSYTRNDDEHYYIEVDLLIIFMDKNKFAQEINIENVKKYFNINPINILYIATPQFIPLPHSQQVKLRTFANKTNISFLTEIEGTIKAQVPKSLGATVNTHTEQISNLNKELDRVKKLEENTVSTVETESDFTTVEATSNGYFEDVKLEGKTLVNLFKIKSLDIINEVNIYVSTQNYELTKGKEVTLVNNTDKAIIYDINKDSGWFRSYILNANTCIKATLKEGEFIKCCYGAGARGWDVNSESDKEKLKKTCIVLEGDHTQNPPSFFEGLKSVGQDVEEVSVESVNENLFDGELQRGYWYNGEIKPSDNAIANVNNIHILQNTQYYISVENYSDVVYIAELDESLNEIKNFTINNGSGFITSTTGTYLRMCTSTAVNVPLTTKIQIVRSTTPKPYTPHQSDKKRLLYYNEETQTWEKPILRQWDSIEKHADGKYYYHQRSGEVVVDNNANIQFSMEYTNTLRFALEIADMVKPTSNVILADKFTVKEKEAIFNEDAEGIANEYGSSRVYFRILKSKLPTQDLQGFKQWLQANNVTVVYQLAQEKVYECTNIDLITYTNETNYVVNSGAISPRTTLKVHNNISNVVSLLQKKVSLLESNITSYMITQNRMQLASTYSADSVTFKVDYALCSEEVEYNEDLYNLILNNILVGKNNYNYDKMFNIILDYASWNQISWEQFDILVGLMDIQHNPPIEKIPTDDEIVEEIPNEIM